MEFKESYSRTDVGVLVARFQVPKLTDVHKDLINTVCAKHDRVIVFLGLAPLMGTIVNPLDFEARKKMVLAEYPNVTVQYIPDTRDDAVWSRKLDESISHLLLPKQSAVLYGGRESFIKGYSGRFPTRELEAVAYISGTELRKEIASRAKGTEDFRGGAIWLTQWRWPSVVATVDVAILDRDRKRMLLVRKNGEDKFRFVGGYTQPDRMSFEDDALTEVREEAGVGVDNESLRYIGSCRIDDWRYRREVDKIKTMFFTVDYQFGGVSINDKEEIAEARWFEYPFENVPLIEEHVPLMELLRKHDEKYPLFVKNQH